MLALVLASGLAALTSDDIQLRLTAVKSQIFVGEATKVRLTWTAVKPVEVLFGSEDVLLDDGNGFRERLEATLGVSTSIALPTPLEPGAKVTTEYVLGLEEIDAPQGLSGLEALNAGLRFAFPSPGRYRIKVRYENAESNEVEIQATTPTGRDAEILQGISQRPLALTWMVGTERELYEPADNLIATYGAHPYLARTILLRTPGDERDHFDRLRAMDFTQSALEDEKMLYVAEHGGQFLGAEWERQALQDVIDKYPDSVAARKAAYLLAQGDQAPPSLAATAAPSQLWPPNGRLVPVTATIDVRDETDPNPKVKLVSITCDDGCNPVQDISGAAFGTDDRAFRLRAKRTGGGSGRTYTITYSATDAAGNAAQQSATVKVPHSQCH